jgi:hypothetical protein
MRACGARARMFWTAVAIAGANASMRAAIWSTPPVTYLRTHGVWNGSTLTQLSATPMRPVSLPPIVIVTSVVSALSASSCGGAGGRSSPRKLSDCGEVRSRVSAPLQVTSRSVVTPSRAPSRCG